MNNLKQLTDQVFMATLPGNEVAIIELATDAECQNKTGKVPTSNGPEPIRFWGNSNNLPQIREELVASNNIVGALISTKRNIVLGAGLQPYKEEWNSEKKKYEREPVPIPPEAEEFFRRNDIDDFIMTNARNLFLHGQLFAEYLTGRGSKGNHIVEVNALEAKHCRAQEQNKKGLIKNWLYSTEWVKEVGKTGSSNNRKVTKIPVITMADIRMAKDANKALPKKFIQRVGDNLISDTYYFEPSWWGSKDWIELANCIPEFHKANLKHGYTIRYQIKYRKGYFDVKAKDSTEKEQKKAALKSEERLQAFIDKMNKFLSGLQNTGRAVYTSFEFSKALQKAIPGVEIVPIKTELHDEALIKLFDKSNEANMSAQGIHPTLANIQTQGKLSSGSEIRLALQTYLAIHAPIYRRMLLKPLNLIHQVNGWPKDVNWGFRDIDITTLDQDKSGIREVQQGATTE